MVYRDRGRAITLSMYRRRSEARSSCTASSASDQISSMSSGEYAARDPVLTAFTLLSAGMFTRPILCD